MKVRNVYKNQPADAVTFAQAEGSLLSAVSYLGAQFAEGDTVVLTKEGEAQVIRILSEKEFKRQWQTVNEKAQAVQTQPQKSATEFYSDMAKLVDNEKRLNSEMLEQVKTDAVEEITSGTGNVKLGDTDPVDEATEEKAHNWGQPKKGKKGGHKSKSSAEHEEEESSQS